MSTTDFLAPQATKPADHSRESSFVMFHVPDVDKPKAATSALTSDELNALTSTTGSADKSTPEGKPALELQNFPSSPTTSFTQLTSPTSEKGDDVKFTQASSTLELEGYPDTPKNCYERKTGCNRALYWSNCCIIAGIILWVIPLFLPAVVSVLMQQQICDKLCVPIPQVLNANGTWVENLNVNNTEDWKLNNFLTNSNRSWWPVEYFNVYLYNITNSAAVIAGNETNLKVKLVGPYVFSTYREKYNASFSPDFEIIYYNQLASYTFLPNLSYPRLLTDTLTVISMPLVSINWMQWEYAKTPYNFLFATLCKNDQRSCLFQTLPASQIIFSSTSTIYNTALGLLKPLAPTFQLFFNYSTNPTVANQQHLVNSFGMGGELHPYIGSFYTFPPPAGLPVAVKFNMTMGRPTTNDSLLNAQYTGQGSSYSNLFGFTQFEGNTSINTWNGPEYISGTDHFQFAPPVTPDSLISVWDDDVMRVVDLQFQEKVSVLGSYDAYRFTPTDDLFSGTDPHYFGAAGYEGLLDVSPVSQIHYGSLVTAYASRPFLAGVNSTLASTVNCTNCPDMSNPDDWLDVFVDIEPNTGKVLGGSKRGQINALIGQPPIYNNNYSLPKIEVSTLYKNIPMSLVPLVYFEYTSLIEWGPQTDQLDDGLNQVKLARIATATLFYLFLSLSSIAFLSSFVIALEADKNGACCTSKPKRPYTGTKTD